MTRSMIIRVTVPSGYGGTRHVLVSLPRIDCLIVDMPGKYSLPESPPPPQSRADSQPIGKRRLYGAHHNGPRRSAPRMTAEQHRELERAWGELV